MHIQPDISICTLWGARKAYFRGLEVRSAKKKINEKTQHLQNLADRIKKQEGNLKENPTATELHQRIHLLQHQINVILSEEIAKKVKFKGQNCFENANKPGTWLSYKLRKERERNLILTLRGEDGTEKYCQSDDLKRVVGKLYGELHRKREISGERDKDSF